MNRPLRWNLCAASVLFAATAWFSPLGAASADEVAAPVGVEVPDATRESTGSVEELAEVWVKGKRLSEVIERAEDEFFVLYNKLNKDSQYDVYCGRMALDKGSMILIRKCVPGFIVFNYGDIYGRVTYGSVGCSGYGGGYIDGSSFVTFNSCTSGGGGYGYSPPVYTSFIQPPADHMLMARRPAYVANVFKVVKSDARLLEMASELGELYKDMEVVQGHYVKVKGAGAPPPNSRRPGKLNLGPRAL